MTSPSRDDGALLEIVERTPGYAPPESGEWPEPLPLPSELPPVAPFDSMLLPVNFRPWIEDITDRLQCPPDFPAVGAMIALAGIVGRKVGIRPKRYDDWLVTSNLWGAVVGRPGVMKTPSIQEPLRFIHELERTEKAKHETAMGIYEAARIVEAQEKKDAEDSIRKAIKDGGDPQALAQSLIKSRAKPPTRIRYVVNDSTVEKLGELLNENPNGVIVFRDELVGFLKSLDREGQESARAFYLEAWNGSGRFTYDRIGRGTVDIESATVSVLGGIQPGPLLAYLEAAKKGGAADDGLMQRLQLIVWPDPPPSWQNIDRAPIKPAQDLARDTFFRLAELDSTSIGAFDADREGGIPFLRFTADAQARFDEWRAELEDQLRGDGEHAAMESHLAKYRSLIPSLALLIHLADGGSGSVGLAPLDQAVAWGKYLETHARRLYAPTLEPEWIAARALAARIAKGDVKDGFAGHEVYRCNWSKLKAPDLPAALTALVGLNWLRAVREVTAGAPRTTYWINPKLAPLLGRCKK